MQDKCTDEKRHGKDVEMLIREDDAAEYLGVTKRTLQQWRFNGKGPLFVRISRRCIRYRRGDLVTWLEKRLASSTCFVTEAEKEER